MGWNIGGGVVFTSTSIFEIEKGLAEWRETVKTLTREKMLAIYAEQTIRKIDDAAAEQKPPPERVMGTIYRQIMDSADEIKKTGHRNPYFDFDFEVSVIPHGRKVYGLVRCEQSGWQEKFLATGLVESFYWFDDECPAELTKREWNRRGRTWQKIFEHDSRPAGHGFNAELTTPLYMVEIRAKDVVKVIAPFEARLQRVCKNIVINRRINLDEKWVEAKANAVEGKGPEISEFSGAMFRATDWIKTDHGQVALELEKAVVAKLLPPVITEEML